MSDKEGASLHGDMFLGCPACREALSLRLAEVGKSTVLLSSALLPALLPSIPPELLAIGEQLRTQDNRCTANPMFVIQGLERKYGMDPQWSDNYVWIDTYDGAMEVPEPADGEETEYIKKSGYVDIWVDLMVCFTEKGCEEHMALNGHNYRYYRETRIYVKCFYRNPEMTAIREWLMALPPPVAVMPELPPPQEGELRVYTEMRVPVADGVQVKVDLEADNKGDPDGNTR